MSVVAGAGAIDGHPCSGEDAVGATVSVSLHMKLNNSTGVFCKGEARIEVSTVLHSDPESSHCARPDALKTNSVEPSSRSGVLLWFWFKAPDGNVLRLPPSVQALLGKARGMRASFSRAGYAALSLSCCPGS